MQQSQFICHANIVVFLIKSNEYVPGHSQRIDKTEVVGIVHMQELDLFYQPILAWFTKNINEIDNGVKIYLPSVKSNVTILLDRFETGDLSFLSHIFNGNRQAAIFKDGHFDGISDPKSMVQAAASMEELHKRRITKKVFALRNNLRDQMQSNSKAKNKDATPKYRKLIQSMKIYISEEPADEQLVNSDNCTQFYQLKSWPNNVPITFIPLNTKTELDNQCVNDIETTQFELKFCHKENKPRKTIRVSFNDSNNKNNNIIDYSKWKFESCGNDGVWKTHLHCVDAGHSFYGRSFPDLVEALIYESIHGILNWIFIISKEVVSTITCTGGRLKNNEFWKDSSNVFQFVGLERVAKQLESMCTNIDLEKIKPSGNTITALVVKLGMCNHVRSILTSHFIVYDMYIIYR